MENIQNFTIHANISIDCLVFGKHKKAFNSHLKLPSNAMPFSLGFSNTLRSDNQRGNVRFQFLDEELAT